MSGSQDVNPATVRTDLLARWRAVFGSAAPVGLSAMRIERAIRYAEQVANDPSLVQLDRQVNRRLKQLAQQTTPQAPKLLAGTRVLREWGGITHEVTVTEQGYLYRGNTYRSLSVIAKLITGAHWSGPKFFGIVR